MIYYFKDISYILYFLVTILDVVFILNSLAGNRDIPLSMAFLPYSECHGQLLFLFQMKIKKHISGCGHLVLIPVPRSPHIV